MKRVREHNAGYIYKFSHEAQALERVEYIVQCLREGYVRDGWRLDEHAAARVVQYFRWYAQGQPKPDPDPEFEFVTKWMSENGQSFDWIFFGDPRGLICRAASCAAVPVRQKAA
jgi:hypothetical protein